MKIVVKIHIFKFKLNNIKNKKYTLDVSIKTINYAFYYTKINYL